MDVNLNAAKCLATQTNWGENIIHNICNGQVHTVPWGTMEYALASGLSAFGVAAVLMIGGLGLMLARDFWRY